MQQALYDIFNIQRNFFVTSNTIDYLLNVKTNFMKTFSMKVSERKQVQPVLECSNLMSSSDISTKTIL